jgi:hypothetical protein
MKGAEETSFTIEAACVFSVMYELRLKKQLSTDNVTTQDGSIPLVLSFE